MPPFDVSRLWRYRWAVPLVALLFWRTVLSAVVCLFGWLGVVSFGTMAVGLIAQGVCLRLPQNLRQKYAAKWAVVTGASSGIGRAIAERLASQGVSVVLVALEDKLLTDTHRELSEKFPSVAIRRCGVDLSSSMEEVMAPIKSATSDIEVALLFNNAGYLQAGMFPDTDFEKVRKNFACNAASVLPITHHFVRLMIEKKIRGLVAFTSSSAGYIAGPCATTYSSTKAFLTNFGVTLAAEVKCAGIDVVVMHPSPVNTNFYNASNAHMGSLQAAKTAAVAPSVIVDHIFASAGRLTVWDQGAISVALRFLGKVIDATVLNEALVRCASMVPDQKKLLKESSIRR